MGTDSRHWKLFVRYLAGECSDREQAEVHALIAVDHEKARLLDELRSIAEAAQSTGAHLDATKAWQNLDQRLQRGARITSLPLTNSTRPRAIGRRRGSGPEINVRGIGYPGSDGLGRDAQQIESPNLHGSQTTNTHGPQTPHTHGPRDPHTDAARDPHTDAARDPHTDAPNDPHTRSPQSDGVAPSAGDEGAGGLTDRPTRRHDGARTDRQPNYNTNHRAGRRVRFRNSALLAAAVFAAVIIGTFIAVDLSVTPELAEQQPDFQIFTTEKGERATVQLADGTMVLLNADSRLTVPTDFQTDVRLVQFEGQGYFDVAESNGLPFVVQTQLADIQVLGTEFDVYAHSDAPEMQVVVATGAVSVRSNHRDEKESIILRQRDLGIVLQAGGQLVRRNINVDRYFAWKEGRLVFENASFQEVAAMLERWYDLSVRLETQTENVDGLTATFRDESVDEVLTVISAALSLNYQKDGKNITFYPAP